MLLLALLALSVVEAVQVRDPKLSAQVEAYLADRDTLCTTMAASFFSPWRCKNASPARAKFDAAAFRAEHALVADDFAPIILMPGFAASGLDAKLRRPEQPFWFCWSQWDSWFNLWVRRTLCWHAMSFWELTMGGSLSLR
jgi:hypothetical protein